MALRAEDRRSRHKKFLDNLAQAFNASELAECTENDDIVQLRQDGLALGIYLGWLEEGEELPADPKLLMTDRFLWVGTIVFHPQTGERHIMVSSEGIQEQLAKFFAQIDESTNTPAWDMPASMAIEWPTETMERIWAIEARLAA